MKLLGTLSLFVLASFGAHAQSTQWRITQPTWTDTHEQQFGEFVSRLGDAVEKRKCGKVDSCLKSEANPYYNSDPRGLKYYSDCADLPYYLRGYFAWKNGLPFSVISEVNANVAPGDNAKKGRDIRYSSLGNYVIKRYDVLSKNGLIRNTYPDATEILNEVIPGLTFSASYRMMGNDDALFYRFLPDTH